MRTLFAVAVGCTSLGLALGFCLHGRTPVAVAGQKVQCVTENGDVNADGKIDLTDAISILGHLFQGNPTVLLPLCAPPPTTLGLPDTGQARCYDDAGNEITCDSSSFPGEDGASTTGCAREGRFTDNSDGTVTDHCTGLMWQKDTADVNGDGQVRDDRSDALAWCAALAYCQNLSFAGHDDWRLVGRIVALNTVRG